MSQLTQNQIELELLHAVQNGILDTFVNEESRKTMDEQLVKTNRMKIKGLTYNQPCTVNKCRLNLGFL